MKYRFSQRGGSMVEFALILPLLIIILFGIIEFGIIMYDKAIVTNASREGARAGVVLRLTSTGVVNPLTSTEIETIVNNYLGSHLISFPPQSVVTLPAWDDPTNKSSGSLLTVTVRYQYNWFILPVPTFVPELAGFNPLNLSATTVMRME